MDAIALILDADVSPVENLTPDHLKDRTLIGFGSGIYWTKIDHRLYEAASLIPKKCKVFMFLTSGMGFSIMVRIYWCFILKNFDRLEIDLVGKWDCRGYDKYPVSKWMGISKEHPNDTDIENAKQFAGRVKMNEKG